MTYDYKCTNQNCVNAHKIIKISKPMAECSREEFCELCAAKMERTVESLVCGMAVDKTGSFYKRCSN